MKTKSLKNTVMKSKKQKFYSLLNSGLKASQIAKACSDLDIRLSTMGWSTYAVEDGELIYNHHYGDDIYSEAVNSASELSFFDDENVGDFEYSQEITPDIIMALRGLK